MDSERVKEIMDSKGVIEVKYNNSPVWIENVRGDVVEVKNIDNNVRMEVPADSLTEGK